MLTSALKLTRVSLLTRPAGDRRPESLSLLELRYRKELKMKSVKARPVSAPFSGGLVEYAQPEVDQLGRTALACAMWARRDRKSSFLL